MSSHQPPNILLILTDQQRYDTLSAHVNHFEVATRGIDALCRRGVTFDNAFCTAPICGPSRATLMTGLMPSVAGVPGNVGAPNGPLSPRLLTIGDRLQARGYLTAYHGKWHLGGCPTQYGFERVFENSHDRSIVDEAARFYRGLDWIVNKRPFFQVVSFMNPHDIYFLEPDVEEPVRLERWPNQDDPLTDKPWPQRRVQDRAYWTDERLEYYRRHYAGLVERVDRLIEELLYELRCGGYANNTWVIFSSDHGDMAGEHGLTFKGAYMYDGVLRVPLVIAPPDPRVLGSRGADRTARPYQPFTTPRLTSLADLPPTILDLGGVEPPPEMPGRSLLPTVRGEDRGEASEDFREEAVFAEWHQAGKLVTPIRTIRTHHWKYNLHLGIGEELYDLEQDPHELENRASDPSLAEVRDKLRRRLTDRIRGSGDPFFQLTPTDGQGRPAPRAENGIGASSDAAIARA